MKQEILETLDPLGLLVQEALQDKLVRGDNLESLANLDLMVQEVKLEIEVHKGSEEIMGILEWLVLQGHQGLLVRLVQEARLVVRVNKASRV